MTNPTARTFGYPNTLVAETEGWLVLVRPKQPTFGALVLVYKEKAEAFSSLTTAAFADLSVAVKGIERTLTRLVAYQKINYLMLMMVDRDVHFHVIPRYEGEREHDGRTYRDAGWPAQPALGETVDLDEAAAGALAAHIREVWNQGVTHADAVVTGRPRLIDRYALRQSAGPLIACLVVLLAALLLERALRLFDLLSGSSARFGYVFELTANLLPHYLGLALPAAFFVSLFVVVARMSDGSEIDAWLASGVGLSRLIRPFVVLGLVLTALSVAVFGYMQPYSRYGYRAVMHAAVNAGWNGRLQAQTFIEPNDKLLMTADGADLAGRKLERLFVRQIRADGLEDITTAASAELRPSTDGKRVELNLVGGQRVRETAPGVFDVTRFDKGVIDAPLEGAAALLRARGGDERELTLGELWDGVKNGHPGITKATMAAEFNARLARALSLPFLPLLAVPLALSAKRSGRAPGLVVAGVTLLAFHHGVQFAESLAGAGRIPAAMVWLPYAVFVALCLWSFHGCRARPGQTPMTPIVEAISDVIAWAKALVKPKREAAA